MQTYFWNPWSIFARAKPRRIKLTSELAAKVKASEKDKKTAA